MSEATPSTADAEHLKKASAASAVENILNEENDPTEKKSSSSTRRKKHKRHVSDGALHVYATFNNTVISFTDAQGNLLTWSTSGAAGYRGARKSTPFAAQEACKNAGRKAIDEYGLKCVTVYIRGPGPGREASVRAVIGLGLKITEIIDVTGIPHNGCRPPKKRRV
ncbi:MAG: hypothetical protein DHS20C10_00610 [marine bacterium B5-7]|nr:MAG: hypothetical protein DHS20C10_00610 [marine bacterium B5-7]